MPLGSKRRYMCSECANVLRMQSEKCPICRTPITQLLKIQINRGASASGEAALAAGGEAAAPPAASSSAAALAAEATPAANPLMT